MDEQYNDDRVPCNICGRSFAPQVLPKHSKVCKKVAAASTKRKPFDSSKQRVIDGELSLKQIKEAQKKEVKPPKSHWREKHQDFIKALRNARALHKALEAGGPLPPPPPPSVNPDYIQCPHCSRRFNQQAAEKHINFCKEKQSIMPKEKLAASKPNTQLATYQPPKAKPKSTAPQLPSSTSAAAGGQGAGKYPAASAKATVQAPVAKPAPMVQVPPARSAPPVQVPPATSAPARPKVDAAVSKSTTSRPAPINKGPSRVPATAKTSTAAPAPQLPSSRQTMTANPSLGKIAPSKPGASQNSVQLVATKPLPREPIDVSQMPSTEQSSNKTTTNISRIPTSGLATSTKIPAASATRIPVGPTSSKLPVGGASASRIPTGGIGRGRPVQVPGNKA